jgi:transposase
MIKSAFQHEEVEELLESEGIDLGDYWHFMKEMNSIYINNFYFKPKTQAKIEFVVQTREGRSMFQRRNISEF